MNVDGTRKLVVLSRCSVGTSDKESRKMARRLRKGEHVLRDIQEWLVIADAHGHETASKFQEGGEMGEIVASSGKEEKIDGSDSSCGHKGEAALSIPHPSCPSQKLGCFNLQHWERCTGHCTHSKAFQVWPKMLTVPWLWQSRPPQAFLPTQASRQ